MWILRARCSPRAGLDESDLECGSHWPASHEATLALAHSGREPTDLYNNCSGKHSGFLCTCRHLGLATRFYVESGHPFQELVRATLEEVTGAAHGPGNRAVDGCSIPTYAVPAQNLARGFARMAAGTGLPPGRARAARRLLDACMAEPWFVSGTGRPDTRLMSFAPGRIFVKGGAEGVWCAAVPELGVGLALKCDDGAERAAESMLAAILSRLLEADEGLSSWLRLQSSPAVTNRKGHEVGRIPPPRHWHERMQGLKARPDPVRQLGRELSRPSQVAQSSQVATSLPSIIMGMTASFSSSRNSRSALP